MHWAVGITNSAPLGVLSGLALRDVASDTRYGCRGDDGAHFGGKMGAVAETG